MRKASIILVSWLAALASVQNPVRAEEVRTQFHGLTVNANLNLADGKSIEDGIVLLLHGSFAHKDMEIMTALQNGLLERGYSSLNINLSYATEDRHGMFGCENVQDRLDSGAIEEIDHWISWLKEQGVTRVVGFGHSRGGNQIARYMANTRDSILAAAVLAAPPAQVSMNSADNYQERHGTPLAPLLATASALVDEGKGQTALEGVGFQFCESTSVTAATFVDNYVEYPDRDTPTVLERLDTPVLVAVGTADEVVSGLAPAMKAMDKANVTFVEIEDAGHFFLDFFAEDLLDAADDFLRSMAF